MLFGTEWDNKGHFETDSNGMNMVKREWNYRPDYTLNYTNEPTSCNFFPINSALTFTDADFPEHRLTVVNDRAQAGSSPTYNGKSFIEMMVHRRLLHDDDRGVGQCLNETSQWNHEVGLRAVVNHGLLLANTDPEQRDMELWTNEPIQLLFGYSDSATFKTSNFMRYEGTLPSNF